MPFNKIRVKNFFLLNSNFRNGTLFTVFSFLNSGISFLLLLLLANYLNPDDYGLLNLFNTFVSLLSVFVCLCSTSYLSVSYFQRTKQEFSEILNAVILITNIVASFLCLNILIFPTLFENLIGINSDSLLLGLLICYTQVFITIVLEIWRIEEKVFSYGIFSFLIALLNLALTFLLVLALNNGWIGRVYSQVMVTSLFFIISLLVLFQKKYLFWKCFQYNKKRLTDLLFFSIPLMPHLLSFWLRQGVDRYIINYYFSTADVGYFSFATNIANIVTIVGSAFNASYSILIYKKMAEGYSFETKKLLSKHTRIMLVTFVLLTTFLILGATVCIPLFFAQYNNSVVLIIPLCISSFFQCLYLLYVNYLFYYKKTKELMFITFSLSVLQVILSLWLTKFGLMFTACISMFITGLIALSICLYSKKLLKVIQI